jgi:hypothetical protein
MNFIVYEIDNTSYFSYDTTTKNNKNMIINVTRKDICLELSKNTKYSLYELCKSLGLDNISKLKKSQLIDLLKSMENKPIDFK